MPAMMIRMRTIKEVMRLKYDAGLSHEDCASLRPRQGCGQQVRQPGAGRRPHLAVAQRDWRSGKGGPQ